MNTVIKRTWAAGKKKISKEIEEKAIEMYLQKTSLDKIVETLGIGKMTINRILKRNNIELNGGNRAYNKDQKRSEDTKQKVSEGMKKYWEKKKSE